MANNLEVGEQELVTLDTSFFQSQQHTEQFDEGTNSGNGDSLGMLIEEVRKYRCLWDSSCRAFKDIQKKQNAWSLIANSLHINAKEAQMQWTKLKENFRKCLKRREKAMRSGAGRTQLPSCQYYKELQFITDTIANRPTCSNVSPTANPNMFAPPSPSNYSQTYPDFAVDSSLNERSVPSPATIVVPPPATVTEGPSNKKRKKDMKDDVNSLLMASIKRDLIATESAESNDKDPDTLFCLSLVQDFKELPAPKKRLARVKIMQVLCEMHNDSIA